MEGHTELATLIASLKQMLTMNRDLLAVQTEAIRLGHQKIGDNLLELNANTMNSARVLGASLDELVSRTEKVLVKFDETIQQLDTLHRTMLNVAAVVNDIQQFVDINIEWIVRRVGGIGKARAHCVM